jgi:predicted Fe-Mo cluster-binding NifX family protein
MKIAIGTDNGKTIRTGHFGASTYYQIIEMLNGQMVGKELRKNPYIETEHAGKSHGQAEQIIELLNDCSLFIARSMGKKSTTGIAAHHIDCIITTFETVDLALSNYLSGKKDGFKFYDVDSGKFISCLQREKNMGC